jgi:glyceraldehyde 3-phosphate dehydrogenase
VTQVAFDSVLGPLPANVRVDGETLSVGEHKLRALSIPKPARLPRRELGIDVVVESTGRFEKREQAQAHHHAGAARVPISAVANDADVTIVLDANEEAYDPEGHRMSSRLSPATSSTHRTPASSTAR